MFDIDRFCAECREAMAEPGRERAVREVVARAVSDPGALMRAIGEPERAGVFSLHRSDDLTILNLVWGPEMRLMPHDHRMWAVIGIYTGREENAFFRRSEPGGLTRLGVTTLEETDCKLLGETAIHAVYNPLTRLTGGLHVYGGDFFGIPRSEWDPETFVEAPYDVDKNVGLFERSNERMEALRRAAAAE